MVVDKRNEVAALSDGVPQSNREHYTNFETKMPVLHGKYSRGVGMYDNQPKQRSFSNFDEFIEAIETDRGNAKGQQYICSSLAFGFHTDKVKHPQKGHWRLASGAEPRSYLPLDCDEFSTVLAFDQFKSFVTRYSGCTYTTANHTISAPRCRVMVALSRLVTRSESMQLGKAFERLVEAKNIHGISFDKCVYANEQPCYLPLKNAQFWKHEGNFALDVDQLLSSEFACLDDAEDSAAQDLVLSEFNSLSKVEQLTLLEEINSGIRIHKDVGKQHGFNSSEAKKLFEKLNVLGAKLNRCWTFNAMSLSAVISELTKDDVNNLNRSQWLSRVLLAGRLAPLMTGDAQKIKSAIRMWSEKHKCYEGYLSDVNDAPEFESGCGKDDPFADFDNRWHEGESSARLDNNPFRQLSYMANMRFPVPKLLLADGSLFSLFEEHQVPKYEASNTLFETTITESDGITNKVAIDALFSDIELRQEDVDAMDEAEIIFPEMIVKGHVQAIVSPANGGKTTILTYVCEKLARDGYNVYYINVDGSPGDLKRQYRHANTHGYKVLAPDARKGGSIQSVHSKLHKLVEGNGVLSNTILIFDTLKKFVQVIEKAKAAAFFKLTRALSVKGATVILLGHTNKHAGEDGQQVFEGTADLRNDVDELIYLDCFKNETDGVLEVTTRPDKIRASLKPKTFVIDLKNGRKVIELGYTKNIVAKEKREVLELAKGAIAQGIHSQKDLLDYLEPKTTEGRQKLRKLLIEFTNWENPEIVATHTGRAKDLKYTFAGE